MLLHRIQGSRSVEETSIQESSALQLLVQNLQEMLGPSDRESVARLMAQIVNDVLGPSIDDPKLAGKVDTPANELREIGLTQLGRLLDPGQVGEVVAWLADKPCFNGHALKHSDLVPRKIGDGAEAHPFGCYAQDDIYGAPHLFELANHPLVLAIAGKYLGCVPTLYSMNLWWLFGHPNPPTITHQFHRDFDDIRFCTLFCYLTDVRVGLGEQEFIRSSHRYDLVRKKRNVNESQLRQLFADAGYRLQEQINDLFKDEIVVVEGPAGSAILADTFGYHRGIPPTSGRRLMFWARYGLYANQNTMVGKSIGRHRTQLRQRLKGQPFANYINRVYFGPLPRAVVEH